MRETVLKYVVSEDIPVQQLPLLDQIILLFKRVLYDESNELRSKDLAIREELKLRANLLEFIGKAIERLRNEGHSSVTMRISSKFEKALEYVTTKSNYAKYYDFEVVKPNIEYEIEYSMLVTMRVKE